MIPIITCKILLHALDNILEHKDGGVSHVTSGYGVERHVSMKQVALNALNLLILHGFDDRHGYSHGWAAFKAWSPLGILPFALTIGKTP